MNEGSDKDYFEVAIGGGKTFYEIQELLGKKVNSYFKEKSILFYVSNTFAVCPNTLLRDVYNNYGTSDFLNINYADNEAWG